MSPYKSLKKQRKAVRDGMKKRRILHDFLKFENYMLVNCLATASEKPLLVRAVGINTDPRKKEGTWVCYLSRFAVNEEKFFEQLEEANFPYVMELGHFYLIKKASKEEIEIFLADKTEKLKEFLEALKGAK